MNLFVSQNEATATRGEKRVGRTFEKWALRGPGFFNFPVPIHESGPRGEFAKRW